jgi:hypothetical protein
MSDAVMSLKSVLLSAATLLSRAQRLAGVLGHINEANICKEPQPFPHRKADANGEVRAV